jgi:hypothetical protein
MKDVGILYPIDQIEKVSVTILFAHPCISIRAEANELNT